MSTNLRVFTSHVKGDTILRFVLEPDSRDLELMNKFGEPEIEVGGGWLLSATLDPPTIVGGAITAVTVDSPGDVRAYSAQRPVVIEAVDPTGAGSGAVFEAVLLDNGRLDSVDVVSGGSNYSAGTTVRITSGGHETHFPIQKVKLLSGFPFIRRITTIPPGDDSLAQLVSLYRGQISSAVQSAMAALRLLDTPEKDLTTETVYQP
ncbi:hypothetical protein EKK58_00020 [Candidatus Dependentiae bacterium]|nr:MAG: hypothetical protein EKK58_00020 [Candidatus Dependentiae bacterium]